MSLPAMEALIQIVKDLLLDQNLTETERAEVVDMLKAGNSPSVVAHRIEQKKRGVIQEQTTNTTPSRQR